MKTPLLQITDVSVTFGGVDALKAVSLDVDEGTIHGLIGPNGAGKSTMFNVISGVYAASAGTVRLSGRDITRLPVRRRVGLGVGRAFQNIVLSKSQTVRDNLLLGRHHLGKAGFWQTGLSTKAARREASRDREAVCAVADLLGLADRLEQPAGSLPYGDQKRLEFARALCAEPRLLLLDEPVAGMNQEETHEMVELIRDVRAQLDLTILLVEHDMSMVMLLSDALTVLDFGRKIAHGSPESIQNNPDVIAAYLGTGDELAEEERS